MSMRRTSRCVPIKCYYQARFCICSLLALKFIVASPEIWGLRIWRRRLDWIYLFLLSNLAEMYFIAPPNCWNISRSPKSLLHIAFRATILCPNIFELKALPCHRYYFFISHLFISLQMRLLHQMTQAFSMMRPRRSSSCHAFASKWEMERE
jgi:hypothetical protein